MSRANTIVAVLLDEAVIDVSRQRDAIMQVAHEIAKRTKSVKEFAAEINGHPTLKKYKVWISTKPDIKFSSYNSPNHYVIIPAGKTVQATVDEMDFGLSHELVHKYQHSRSRYRANPRGASVQDRTGKAPSDNAYYGASFEIMAYAEMHVRTLLASGWSPEGILDRLKNPKKYKGTKLEKIYLNLPDEAKNKFLRQVYDYAQRLNK